jgi:hypothetical protein
MIPCRHIQSDQTCVLGRKPLDCACRSYDSAYKPSREQVEVWAKVMADIGSDRALGLYVLTHAAIGGVILATIGITVMLMRGYY